MTIAQKVIKYWAIALAVLLTVMIVGLIIKAVVFIGGSFTEEDVIGELQNYYTSSDVQRLDIEINAADVYVKEGETLLVESNLKNLKVEEKNGCLTIKDSTKVRRQLFDSNTFKEAVFTLYVPEGTVFDEINLTTGAVRLTVDVLSAKTIDLKLGAGDVSIGSLFASKSADIEGGAGRITVSGGSLNGLDLEMGVGELNLTSALSGECKLELGIGASNITLIGNSEDYELEVEKGIGSIYVDGKAVTDFGSSGNGTAEVKISGGIGEINVRFEEE